MVTSVPSTTSTTSTSSTATKTAEQTAQGSLSQTFDTFLTLLTTQLKNQDPLSPMDSAEFTQQLVSYAGVEQQINSNTKLQKLLDQSASNALMNASTYLDKYVEMDTNHIGLEKEGTATFSYNFTTDRTKVTATVMNEDGVIVRTLDGTEIKKTAGAHEVTWDGKTTDGNWADAGLYTVLVTGIDADGKTEQAAITTFGKVTDVTNTDSGVMLTVAGAQVGQDKVKNVRAAPKA